MGEDGEDGESMGEDRGRWREDGGGGVNSVGMLPVRKLLPPSPADPTVFGMAVLQVFLFFNLSISLKKKRRKFYFCGAAAARADRCLAVCSEMFFFFLKYNDDNNKKCAAG